MGRIRASLLILSSSHSFRGRLERGACSLFFWDLNSQKLQTVDPSVPSLPSLVCALPPGRQESNPLVWEGLSALFMVGGAGALGSWEVMPAPLPSRGS